MHFVRQLHLYGFLTGSCNFLEIAEFCRLGLHCPLHDLSSPGQSSGGFTQWRSRQLRPFNVLLFSSLAESSFFSCMRFCFCNKASESLAMDLWIMIFLKMFSIVRSGCGVASVVLAGSALSPPVHGFTTARHLWSPNCAERLSLFAWRACSPASITRTRRSLVRENGGWNIASVWIDGWDGLITDVIDNNIIMPLGVSGPGLYWERVTMRSSVAWNLLRRTGF